MVHVLAIITARPGFRHNILEHFRANVAAVQTEPGCLEYGATIDAEDAPQIQTSAGADTFIVVEKWESMEALRAHGAAPHMVAYAAKTKELIASRVIHILKPT